MYPLFGRIVALQMIKVLSLNKNTVGLIDIFHFFFPMIIWFLPNVF